MTSEQLAKSELQWRQTTPRPKKGGPAGKMARAEEFIPKKDYIAYLRELGPREGESLLAYEARLAYIARSRELWLAAWKKAKGARITAGELLGVAPSNVNVTLRRCGLTPQLLNSMTGMKK